mmetsp:Transcript_27664/g.89341  ORF Transcript_27664/g.89341 Transcript_27664/m.89341 type:complete len:225 (+) Transcript_27664:2217-2891(+)
MAQRQARSCGDSGAKSCWAATGAVLHRRRPSAPFCLTPLGLPSRRLSEASGMGTDGHGGLPVGVRLSEGCTHKGEAVQFGHGAPARDTRASTHGAWRAWRSAPPRRRNRRRSPTAAARAWLLSASRWRRRAAWSGPRSPPRCRPAALRRRPLHHPQRPRQSIGQKRGDRPGQTQSPSPPVAAASARQGTSRAAHRLHAAPTTLLFQWRLRPGMVHCPRPPVMVG